MRTLTYDIEKLKAIAKGSTTQSMTLGEWSRAIRHVHRNAYKLGNVNREQFLDWLNAVQAVYDLPEDIIRQAVGEDNEEV
jgi:Txe/YoeB family toxin of Txe-Axe toxin-antitoxin module